MFGAAALPEFLVTVFLHGVFGIPQRAAMAGYVLLQLVKILLKAFYQIHHQMVVCPMVREVSCAS